MNNIKDKLDDFLNQMKYYIDIENSKIFMSDENDKITMNLVCIKYKYLRFVYRFEDIKDKYDIHDKMDISITEKKVEVIVETKYGVRMDVYNIDGNDSLLLIPKYSDLLEIHLVNSKSVLDGSVILNHD